MAFTKITAAGIGSTETVTLDGLSVINNGSFGGNLTVSGVLTYEDVTNVDSIGLITARNGVVVGSGITLSKDGDIFATGIVTAPSFVGSGAELTGVASTENIRTNTNAAFLQNISVVGTSTVTGNIVPSSDSATDIGTNSVRFQNAYVDTYYGDGSNLTGIDASTLKSGSDIKAQANASGIVVTGIMTATRGVGIGTTTTTGRNAGVSTVAGTVVYNTDSTSLQVYTGSEWVSVQAADRPIISSISGAPTNGTATNLTFSVSNTTSTVTVRYYLTNTDGTLLATTADVSVSSGSFTTAVPAAVYGRSAGDVIAMTIETTDNITSLPSNKTVISLPTGGTITTSGGQRIHTFTSSGNLVFPDGYGSKSATYLIVAGGGSGGNNTSGSFENGGGGGAGGMLSGSTTLANNTTYAIVVGAGGARPSGNANGTTKGSNSTGLSQTAIGGGGGGYNGGVGGSASNGGSGGGAINWNYSNSVIPGSGTSGQGNDGGNGSGSAGTNGGTGGGGGKSAAGQNSSGTQAGNGGAGQASSISGSSVTYAGGGGGGAGQGGSGGAGGGGAGGSSSSQAAASGGNGTANRGGGGGGNWWNDGSNDGYGGNGGSGIVIVSYSA